MIVDEVYDISAEVHLPSEHSICAINDDGAHVYS